MKGIAQVVVLLPGIMIALVSGCTRHDKGYVEDTDPEMAAAIAKAQETLPQFWQAYEQRSHGESNFTLIVKITDKGRIEHFFTTDFEHRDGKTIVTITNRPKIVASVKAGDRIEVPPADITDWFYMRNGKYVGLRSMPPRFKHMPAEQVKVFKREMVDP